MGEALGKVFNAIRRDEVPSLAEPRGEGGGEIGGESPSAEGGGIGGGTDAEGEDVGARESEGRGEGARYGTGEIAIAGGRGRGRGGGAGAEGQDEIATETGFQGGREGGAARGVEAGDHEVGRAQAFLLRGRVVARGVQVADGSLNTLAASPAIFR